MNMKFNIFAGVMILLLSSEVHAETYLEEMKGLGYVAGEGLACQAKRYPSYELIARAYMVTKARNDKEQASGMYAYNNAKVSSYLKRRAAGYHECGEINNIFNNQKIFKSHLYKNGTIKLPDGKILKPRRKYDASLLYDRSSDERSKIEEFYQETLKKKEKLAKEQGIYNKILKEEMKHRR